MGWVKENLVQHEESVEGIIIVADGDERLRYALNIIPSVKLFVYNIDFELKEEEW